MLNSQWSLLQGMETTSTMVYLTTVQGCPPPHPSPQSRLAIPPTTHSAPFSSLHCPPPCYPMHPELSGSIPTPHQPLSSYLSSASCFLTTQQHRPTCHDDSLAETWADRHEEDSTDRG
eukprot:1322071-Rhodomonas_salina.1